MIRYQLRCSAPHEFEGWFRSSDEFDRLVARGLVSCPECGELRVERALMAPSVVGRAGPPPASRETKVAPSVAAPRPGGVAVRPTGAVLPDRMRAMLTRLREAVERDCEYVGADFAREARRIHDGEADGRAIFGEATDAEHERLVDDGIAVARIPWLPRADG